MNTDIENPNLTMMLHELSLIIEGKLIVNALKLLQQ